MFLPYASGPTEAAGQPTYLPLCPSQNSLERQLSEPREGAPVLTFGWGERGPVILPTTPSQANNPTSQQMGGKISPLPTAELRVSFLYNQDQPPGQTAINPASQLLFRYSMDYCLMPSLKVGLSGYLYKPTLDYFAWRNSSLAEPVFGVGPGIKYDLGRWSFLLRSELEPGTKDRGEVLHNWFRVWYAF